MEEIKKIKLRKFRGILSQEVVLVGESVDWSSMGGKPKRDLIKKRGVKFTLIKKSLIDKLYKNAELFRGNVILITFSKKLTQEGLKKEIKYLERELGVLPLFLVNKGRVLSMSYFDSLLKEEVSKASFPLLLVNTLTKTINGLNIGNKNMIKIISKSKK